MNENLKLLEYRAAFEMCDTDKDGKINLEEFGIVMKSLGVEFTEIELEDMFKDICSNEEKLISYSDLCTIMNKKTKFEIDMYDEYIEAFRVFESEENPGRVSLQVLDQILRTLGENVKDEEIDLFLKEANVKDDGYIDYEEFIKLMLNKQ